MLFARTLFGREKMFPFPFLRSVAVVASASSSFDTNSEAYRIFNKKGRKRDRKRWREDICLEVICESGRKDERGEIRGHTKLAG